MLYPLIVRCTLLLSYCMYRAFYWTVLWSTILRYNDTTHYSTIQYNTMQNNIIFNLDYVLQCFPTMSHNIILCQDRIYTVIPHRPPVQRWVLLLHWGKHPEQLLGGLQIEQEYETGKKEERKIHMQKMDHEKWFNLYSSRIWWRCHWLKIDGN